MLLSEAPDFLPMPMSDAHRPAQARKRPRHDSQQSSAAQASQHQGHGTPGPGRHDRAPSHDGMSSAEDWFDYNSARRAAPGLDLAASGPASRGHDEGRGRRGRRGRGRGKDSCGRAQGASFDGRQKTRKMVNPWAVGGEDSGPRGGAGFGRRGGGQRGRGNRHEGGGGVSRNRSMPKAGNKSMNF